MIPNTFHFIFGLKPQEHPFHLVYYLCILSCIEINKPSKVHLYYQHEPFGRYWKSIRDRLTLHKVAPLRRLNGYDLNYAHKSDFLRLEILNEYGGVYADIDTIFLNPLSPEFYEEDFVLGREDIPYPFYGLCNAFIMARAGSEFGKLWLGDAMEEYNGSWNYHSVRYPKKLAIAHPGLIRVEPQVSFYKHMWDEEGIENLFTKVNSDMSGCYSFHLWENISWENHLETLTEENIMTKETTYNLIARAVLKEALKNSALPVRGRCPAIFSYPID